MDQWQEVSMDPMAPENPWLSTSQRPATASAVPSMGVAPRCPRDKKNATKKKTRPRNTGVTSMAVEWQLAIAMSNDSMTI